MKKNFLTGALFVLLAIAMMAGMAEAAPIKPNSDARLNTLDLSTDSTITSQNKFLNGLKFGGQSWGQPAGRSLVVYADTTLTCAAHSGKLIIFGTGFGDAVTITLPESEPDCEFTFIWDNANTNVIDPTATDVISCDASATAAGATMTATDIGDMMKITGASVNKWYCTGVSLVTGFTFN